MLAVRARGAETARSAVASFGSEFGSEFGSGRRLRTAVFGLGRRDGHRMGLWNRASGRYSERMSSSPPSVSHDRNARTARAVEVSTPVDPAGPDAVAETPRREPVTLRTLGRMAARGEPFACLACYDFTTARWLDRAGVHLLLVGDSAAEVVLGYDRTVHMPLEISIALTAAVKRGAPGAVVMGDMPFMSYQADVTEGVRNAGRYLTEGRADIVKIEAGAHDAELVQRMTRAGIPVCAHIGSLPQRAAMTSGYTSAGRTAESAAQVLNDAVALEAAGAAMLLIEATPAEVTRLVLERTEVPLIGIGAGPAPHGQILVVNDLLGLTDHPPRFADAVAQFGPAVARAGAEWVRRVAARDVGGQAYTLREGEADKLGIRAEAGDETGA